MSLPRKRIQVDPLLSRTKMQPFWKKKKFCCENMSSEIFEILKTQYYEKTRRGGPKYCRIWARLVICACQDVPGRTLTQRDILWHQTLIWARDSVLRWGRGARQISSIKSFTDSQNYAFSGDMQLNAIKWEQEGARLSRANTTPRVKRGVTTSKNPTLFYSPDHNSSQGHCSNHVRRII